ncbi:MAG TPA: hypothetical protein VK656_07455, partial [Candidatus Acidoferrum sp.]|nr:hypothetical protein [Candidatus Acidoferrum sp.]
PAPTGSAAPSPTATPTPIHSIAEALTSSGATLRIEGTVTVAGMLLDRASRVIVIQDATAAIAVKLPRDAHTPRIGDRLQVDGKVGRAYGAPRFDATVELDLGPGAPVSPLVVSTAPGPAHEWRLVRVDGTLTDVHRSGDAWRADLVVGSVRIAIVGIAAAGIPASALVEGRRATIVGFVKRPYPTATDRRFAVVPRSPADIHLGAATGGGSTSTGSTTGSSKTGTPGAGATGGSTSSTGPATGVGTTATAAAWIDVDIATLRIHIGQRVRLGGIVVSVDMAGGSIAIDDGTAIGRVLLGGEAATYLALLESGDALNATGTVAGTATAPELRVTAAADLVRVGDVSTGDPAAGAPSASADPGLTDPTADPAGGNRPGASDGPEARTAGLTLLPGFDGPSSAGVGSLVGISLLSIAVTLIRRRRVRRAFATRVAQRLATFAGPSASPDTRHEGGPRLP